MRKRLRRSLAAMGLMGLLAASALSAGITTSGAANAGAECVLVGSFYQEVYTGTGDEIKYEWYFCVSQDGHVSSEYRLA